MREQGTQHAGHKKLDSEGKALSLVLQHLTENAAGARSAVEQGDSPIGQSEPLRDDDTYLGNRGSKKFLGEVVARESLAPAATITAAFPRPTEPKPETQSKGWVTSRRHRPVTKRQAEDAQGDPDPAPMHLQPRPEAPQKPRISIQNGGKDPAWDAEPTGPPGRLAVVYFSGRRERLLLRPEALAEIPREAFTVEAWVKPEGGQNNPAIITGKSPPRASRGPGWEAGSIPNGLSCTQEGTGTE